MSEELSEGEERSELKPVAIEGKLPLKAVGIENLKEANPKHMPPHRYLHPWFARRPTPVSRLAILASVLPQDIDSDLLLDWMKIGPSEPINGNVEKYVERKKATEAERSGTLAEHYGYSRPFTRTISPQETQELHKELRDQWDGSLPTILDPTAGGGVIPYGSLRYSLPTKANELNAVPGLVLRILLQYAPSVGSLDEELKYWGEKIKETAWGRLEEIYPSAEKGQTPDSYVCTYSVTCSSCGTELPLIPKWWIRSRRSARDVIVKPSVNSDGTVSFTCYEDPSDEVLDGFDPNDGPVSRGGDAECLNCGVVTESEDMVDRLSDGEFEYTIYCVKYIDRNGDYHYRSPEEFDTAALQKAEEGIQSDYRLSTILSTEIPPGQKTDEPRRYGMTQWRDLYSPRQLVSLYEYLRAFEDHKSEILDRYEQEKSEAILSLLTLVGSKLIDYNSRLATWHMNKGYPGEVFKGKNLSFKRVFVDNNISVGSMGYDSHLRKISDSYEEIVNQLPEGSEKADLTIEDASDLPYESESIQAVVVDPPYYSSIMYAELADYFYSWMRKYIGDVFPDQFSSELTNKQDEAVANPKRYSDVAGSSSGTELAKNEYESKMGKIFSNLFDVIEPGGVMTVMFTHKETDAWDTLTMSLINSGFTITSTHPITSEMPQRAGMRESASADSTLLLTGRKPHEERDPENEIPTLWSDVRADTRNAATEAARDLLDSGLSLTKTDVIISAFGPTLRVFADAYPVVDDEDNEVPPRRALEEAREAVTRVLVEEFLENGEIEDLDDVSEWYILSWLVHEKQTFAYDDGNQLGHGIGVDIDEIKRSTKVWRKSRGDIKLRGHADRVQNVNEKPEDRSSRLPVNPDDLSFSRSLDAVHAAMHVYDVQGESACCDWLRERNFDTDSTFKATLKALLQVLPHDHEDWELGRDLAVGRTRDVLDLEFSPNVFADDGDETQQSELTDH